MSARLHEAGGAGRGRALLLLKVQAAPTCRQETRHLAATSDTRESTSDTRESNSDTRESDADVCYDQRTATAAAGGRSSFSFVRWWCGWSAVIAEGVKAVL